MLSIDTKIDDLGQILSEFRAFSRFWKATTAKQNNEDRPVMCATKLLPTKCAFQRCIDYVVILQLQGVPLRGGVKQRWSGKTSYFEAKCVNISKTVGYTSKVAYALSIDTKIDDLG